MLEWEFQHKDHSLFYWGQALEAGFPGLDGEFCIRGITQCFTRTLSVDLLLGIHTLVVKGPLAPLPFNMLITNIFKEIRSFWVYSF